MVHFTLDDLIPLEEFVPRRREFLDLHRNYLDRYRRVRIGPHLTLVFENRQTLWFRIQEIIRIARLSEPGRLQEELNLFNLLLPKKNHLQASVFLETSESTQNGITDLGPDSIGEHLSLQIPPQTLNAQLITSRPEDRCFGTAQWVQFELDDSIRNRLADLKKSIFFSFDNGYYRFQSPILSEEIRQSLLDDLALSDRDE